MGGQHLPIVAVAVQWVPTVAEAERLPMAGAAEVGRVVSVEVVAIPAVVVAVTLRPPVAVEVTVAEVAAGTVADKLRAF